MKNKTLIILLSLILYSSCDPIFDINLQISNQSDEDIMIVIPNDSVIIASGSKEFVYNYSGIGDTTDDTYEKLDSIPIEFITIQQGSKIYNKDSKDKMYWDYQKYREGQGGIATLNIAEEDFD